MASKLAILTVVAFSSLVCSVFLMNYSFILFYLCPPAVAVYFLTLKGGTQKYIASGLLAGYIGAFFFI
jgi:hypothetical protein